MIALNRIDSRLIHGQVIEAWLPHLSVSRVVVADEDVAKDPLAKVAYGMAMPPDVELLLGPVAAIDFAALGRDNVRTLVLFRDVRGAVEARQHGLPDGPLNLGNVHAGPGRVALSRSVFLDEADAQALRELASHGMDVRVQAVPTEQSVAYPISRA
jgi:mannose/fructose/N-acetylgalactosamine-specific phosphotransferase system component IIB